MPRQYPKLRPLTAAAGRCEAAKRLLESGTSNHPWWLRKSLFLPEMWSDWDGFGCIFQGLQEAGCCGHQHSGHAAPELRFHTQPFKNI